MFRHRLLKIALGSLLVLAGLILPACQSTGGSAEALTGRVGDHGSPRFESHSKGANWGHVVYDR